MNLYTQALCTFFQKYVWFRLCFIALFIRTLLHVMNHLKEANSKYMNNHALSRKEQPCLFQKRSGKIEFSFPPKLIEKNTLAFLDRRKHLIYDS